MSYTSWSVVFGEQPSAAKWNILGTNDASFNDGTGLPTGTCVQIAQNVTTAVDSTTTTIPFDDTIPQLSEGKTFMSQAITPRRTTNILVIEGFMVLGHSAGTAHLVGAIFQDSTANALAASGAYQATASGMVQIYLRHTMTAGTTSSTTFKVNGGSGTAGTVTFNGVAGARYFGAITKSSMVIREYTV